MTRHALQHYAPALVTLLLLAGCSVGACGEEPTPPKAEVGEDTEADAEFDTLNSRSGRYRRRRSQPGAPDMAQDEFERLAAIGYLEGTRDAHKSEGVVRYVPGRTDGGYNLYVSAHAPQATLMDMEGRVLHQWHHPSKDIWPGKKQDRKGARYFRRAYLMDDGALLVIFEGLGIAKFDAQSRLIWSAPAADSKEPVAHHDLEIQPNGDILGLTRRPRVIKWIHKKRAVLDDHITVWDADGQKKQQISLAGAFKRSAFRKLVRRKKKKGDIFHTNSVHRLDGSIAHVNPAFSAGNILLSLRHMDLLAVLDPTKKEIVWARRGPYKAQHDAEILANGSLFLFNNGSKKVKISRAIELDPDTLALRWEYAGSDADPLWTETCGTVQRLSNGNTLVVESDNGRAIEVTSDGHIVWEFLSGHRAGEEDELVATLFDVTRLPGDTPIPWVSAMTGPAKPPAH